MKHPDDAVIARRGQRLRVVADRDAGDGYTEISLADLLSTLCELPEGKHPCLGTETGDTDRGARGDHHGGWHGNHAVGTAQDMATLVDAEAIAGIAQ